MATQLGDVEISKIEGTTLHGWFRSIYEKNVYTASPGWAASMLYDAFSSLVGQHRDESELRKHIVAAEFSKPGTSSTNFTVEVDDPAILTGLTTGAWESYYIG